jgi:hypothetical protein
LCNTAQTVLTYSLVVTSQIHLATRKINQL